MTEVNRSPWQKRLSPSGTPLAAVGLLGQPTATLILSSWIFALAIQFCYVQYLDPVWSYYGFTRSPLGMFELALIVVFTTCGAIAMPKSVDSPSSVVLLLLYIVVYIPAIVITLNLDTNRVERYLVSLVALTVSFSLACVASKSRRPNHRHQVLPDARFTNVMLSAWVALCVVLVATYFPIMTLSGLDDIYEQRAAGASANIWMGYAQTYFGNVVSPALIALGLTRSKTRWVALGSAGCLIMYMINAQRTIFLLPVAMIAIHAMLGSKLRFVRSTAFPMLMLAVLFVWSVAFYEDNPVASLLALFLVFRTFSIPGLTISQYHDLFAMDGYTWWSHIKGLDLVVAPPTIFAGDPSWPNLGYIVGDRVYGNVENNVNANLFSGDGLAAAGPFGVLVIGFVLACWLILLDRSARGWDSKFSALAILPLGLALTNGHFFTAMLSFGGIFWLIAFHFLKPAASLRSKARSPLAAVHAP